MNLAMDGNTRLAPPAMTPAKRKASITPRRSRARQDATLKTWVTPFLAAEWPGLLIAVPVGSPVGNRT